MASALVSSIVMSVFLASIATVSARTAPESAPSGPLNLTGILDKNGQYTYFLRFLATVSARTAPESAPSGPLNLTGILDKNGQYTYFLRFLADTQVGSQIQNELNTTTEGFTVFAPTDKAFNNLKPGLFNGLDSQMKVQLVLYHVLPKYYTLDGLQFVSNPVRTQATTQDGTVYVLNFTGQNNQVNVSSGVTVTPVNNALYQKKPLAVYEVDKVLLPVGFPGANSPLAAPAPAPGPKSAAPAAAEKSESSGTETGLGLVLGIALACVGFLS